MYEIKGLTKQYKGSKKNVHALAGVDLIIPDNDLMAVQGPTGHGKKVSGQQI